LLTGFTNLARTLTTGTITFIYLAPVIIICSVTLQDLFHLLKDTAFVRASRIASNYYYLIDRAIRLGAFYLLCRTFLASFTLTSLFQQVWEDIWNFGGQFGEFNITIGDVLEFFIIIFISWAISAVLKVLLTDEILSRTSLKRGVPMAIGVIVRYTVIFLGFILAVASTGFDLAKISILAGGLGVGIGFGLQHLVANFIAGLILIFERPIVVGDTIESELIEGEVKQIGIRSSKILTYDGAEVIIPNSNLINNKLSNWTLSNYSRRQLIIVRTSMKADPEKVLEILNRITRQHENILATPEPFVLFDGQLEQSLQFKIYYWLISGIFQTRGELNLQRYRELKGIGVELPIPVQEIRRSVGEEQNINDLLIP
jgi:small-conductance mechanosensitive channel